MSDEKRDEMKEQIKKEIREEMGREMRWHGVPRAVRLLVIAILCFAVLALVGWLVMSLWNWLLPGLFGFKVIGYWQAVGLMVLSRLLFGGFRATGGPRGPSMRMRMKERWEQMTPEERERFRQGLRSRWGGPPRDASPTA
jgi:hypothetical protein